MLHLRFPRFPRFLLPLTSVLCLLTSPLFLSSARAGGWNDSAIWDSPLAEHAFASGPAWFSAGPAWLMHSMPGVGSYSVRARANTLLLESSGDPATYEAAYVGTLSDVSNPDLLASASGFTRLTGTSASIAPNAPTATKQYDGNGGTSTVWATAANWAPDGVPLSTDDVVFDNTFRSTLQNVQLSGSGNNFPANSITLNLTTDQTWGLGASSGTTSATLTLTTGNITRNSTTNNSLLTIGATSGTGIGTGILVLATTSSGFTITNLDTTGNLQINATITGSKTVTTVGPGTTIFSGANTYTGSTLVSTGTLVAGTGTLVSTSSVTVNSGGTLMLSGNGRHLGANSDVFLNGGTFNTGGFSEPTTTHDSTAASYIGPLTLQGTSTLDLATGSSIIAFSNSSTKTWTGTLNIYNWSGTALLGNGTDQVYFGTDATGLTVAQLNSINFYSDNGTTFLGTGIFAPDLDGEIIPTLVPVPEASTWIGAALALGAIGWTQRKRLKS